MDSHYKKPNMLIYRITQFLSNCAARIIFRRKILRNELKGKKGPIIVIANHQAALDFTNLIGVTHEPMSFVISNSFYQTLPIKGLMDMVGVIPKQQFQTSLKDIHAMKAVIDEGKILTLYPAGLMCEDGRSTPIPVATSRFLQWMHADIYMAKTYGSYFCTPKWSKKRRRGTTYIDVYKLLSIDEMKSLAPEIVAKRINEALEFDAYREQEELKVEYRGGDNVEGLENVLYVCPNCGKEFTVKAEGNRIFCSDCGYEQRSDRCGFLTKTSEHGEQIRYVSDWARLTYEHTVKKIDSGELTELSATAKFHTVDEKKHKFREVGEGTVTLTRDHFYLKGRISGEPLELSVPTASFASLPFKPGRHIEVQHNDDIFRCVLDDGHLAMKFINMVKYFYELHQAAHAEQKQ